MTGWGSSRHNVWPEDQGCALVLDMGKATLEVFDEKQAQTIDQIEVGRRISGPVRLALEVPDLNAVTQRLLAHGATLVHAAVVTPWGDTNVRLQDPGWHADYALSRGLIQRERGCFRRRKEPGGSRRCFALVRNGDRFLIAKCALRNDGKELCLRSLI